MPTVNPSAFKQDVKIKGGINYANMAVRHGNWFCGAVSGMFFKGREIDCPPGTIIDYKLNDNVDLGAYQNGFGADESRERRRSVVGLKKTGRKLADNR